MLERWALAVERAMEFRARVGDDRFADVPFAALQADPLGAIAASYERIGIELSDDSRAAVAAWAAGHEPGSHGAHRYELADFGLDADAVRRRFARYIDAYTATD
jgi:hypothetical protein